MTVNQNLCLNFFKFCFHFFLLLESQIVIFQNLKVTINPNNQIMSTNNLHFGLKTRKLQLKNQHGVVNIKKLRTLERDYIRLAQVRNITVLRHCCTHGVILKGLHIKLSVKFNQIIKVIKNTSLNI